MMAKYAEDIWVPSVGNEKWVKAAACYLMSHKRWKLFSGLFRTCCVVYCLQSRREQKTKMSWQCRHPVVQKYLLKNLFFSKQEYVQGCLNHICRPPKGLVWTSFVPQAATIRKVIVDYFANHIFKSKNSPNLLVPASEMWECDTFLCCTL